jgi:FMN reductase
MVYLGASPVRTAVYAATSDFGGEGAGRLHARIERAAAELAAALAGSGPTGRRPADPYDDVVPLEELLRESGSPGERRP